MKRAHNGLALHHVVLRQIIERQQRAAFLEIVDKLPRHRAMVKIFGIGGDALKRGRKQRLAKDFTGFVQVAVALKDMVRRRKARQVRISKLASLLRGQNKARARQLNGGRHHALESKAAVSPLRINQASNGPGRGDGAVAENARVGNHVAARVEIHVLCSGQRSLFAVVEKNGFAGVLADQHKAAAAQVARGGMDHGESKTRGHRSVNSVAALLKNSESRIAAR